MPNEIPNPVPPDGVQLTPVAQPEFIRSLNEQTRSIVAQSPRNLVDAFIAQHKKLGFLRSNRFAIILRPNEKVFRQMKGSTLDHRTMNIRLSQFCRGVVMPERGISTSSRDVAGPTRKVGYRRNYGDSLSMTFNLAADAAELIMFQKWQDMVVNPISHRIGYYENYAMGCKMLVLMLPNYVRDYDQVIDAASMNKLPGVMFDEIYPIGVSINDGNLDMDSAPNENARLKITFSYRNIFPATFDEMVQSGYVVLDEREFTPSGKLLDPNAQIPPTETAESTRARADKLAQNGFVITPENSAAIDRNKEYLNAKPTLNRSISFNQLLNLGALL